MLSRTLRHLNLLVFTLLILSFFSFLLAYLFPGEAISNLSGIENPSATQHSLLTDKYKLNNDLLMQYLQYMKLMFDGDWGESFSTAMPLADILAERLPATIELVSYALLLSLLVGLPLGYLAGMRYHKKLDYAIQSTSAVLYSIPVFWLAILLILILCMQTGFFPVSGRVSLLFDIPHQTGFVLVDIWLAEMPDKQHAFASAFRHLILPTLSISIITAANIVRIIRRSFVDVLREEFIDAARTRGLSFRQIFFRHALRNSLVPIFPLLGAQVTILFTNAMIVETIFSWPGVGSWLIQAIYQQDYPAIRAGMLAVSCVVVTITVLLELMAKLFDPTKDTSNHATT